MTDQVLIDAIAYALSREVVPSEDYYGNMTDVQRRRAVSIAGMAEVDQVRYVMSQVNSALINGQSFEQFKQNVNLVDIELPKHRLSLIYQQNIQQAYAYGRYVEQVRNQDSKPYLMYKSKNDSRVRPWHQVLNGTIRPIGDAFWINSTPPLDWNCFLPETKISGDITAAMVKSYKGKAIKLTTHSGQTLSMTSNHPVLTERGWIAANCLRVGDNVLRHSLPVDLINIDGCSRQVNNKQAVASAENLFHTFLLNAFAFGGVATLKFNSDVANGVINIDILDSCLRLNINSNIAQGFCEVDFVRRLNGRTPVLASSDSTTSALIGAFNAILSKNSLDVALTEVETFCNLVVTHFGCCVELNNFSFECVVFGVSSSPSSSQLPLNATRRLFDGLPLDKFRLGLGSHGDAIVDEVSSNDMAADSGLFGYLVDAHSGEVLLDPVVEVFEFDFSGHVYDFQSSESLLSSDNIITHNCRCRTAAITIEEAEALGVTKAIDLKYVIPEKGFGKLPIHFDDTLEQLLQDKITSAAIENHKQSGIIAKISGRIKETAVKILSSPAASLSSLIAKAKEKLSNEK